MEIRTCEEYVLNRLFEAEDALAEIRDNYDEMCRKFDSVMKSYQELKDIIYQIATINDKDKTCEYIYFNSIYKNFSNEEAAMFKKLMQLVPTIKVRED